MKASFADGRDSLGYLRDDEECLYLNSWEIGETRVKNELLKQARAGIPSLGKRPTRALW
jgi:hypothetical protein